MVTKWDRLDEQERAALDATPLGVGCSNCYEWLATEGVFARHFIVRDTRYLNIGYCPNPRADDPR